MKGSGKIILWIAVLSSLLVLYVHAQTQLFRVSYTLDREVKERNLLLDRQGKLKYELDQMKAPRLLEEKLSRLQFDLTLPAEIRVIRLAPPVLPQLKIDAGRFAEKPVSQKFSDFFERWVKVAQAKTDG